MENSDISQVYSLGVSSSEFSTQNGSFWTQEQLENWQKSETDLLLVAEHENKVIGFTFFAGHAPTKKATWENLYVAPEYRKRGIADALAKTGMKEIKSLGYIYVMGCIRAEDRESFLKYCENIGFKDGGLVTWIDQKI